MIFLEAFVSPKRFRIGAVVQQMFEVWVKALLIVGVLCFLIGVVIAYQGVQQLGSSAPRPSPSRRSASACSASWARC